MPFQLLMYVIFFFDKRHLFPLKIKIDPRIELKVKDVFVCFACFAGKNLLRISLPESALQELL